VQRSKNGDTVGAILMTPSNDWEEFTKFALALAEAAGRAILPHFRQDLAVDVKPHYGWDPVTEGDKAGERAIRKLIEERYPDHGINGEEYGMKPARAPYTWVLDPIDGTRGFVLGMPTWTTLIGLTFEDRPIVGVMSQPFVGEAFYGNPRGAWHARGGKTKSLRTRNSIKLSDAMAATTSPEQYRSDSDMQAFARLSQRVKMMRYGGDAYFYAVLAAGHLDIAMDAGLQPYDIAALIPIIAGAGGVIGSWSGTNPAQGGDVIAAGSQALLEEALAAMMS
jgi:myo-inositol-1(or 4)-monophosphatase